MSKNGFSYYKAETDRFPGHQNKTPEEEIRV